MALAHKIFTIHSAHVILKEIRQRLRMAVCLEYKWYPMILCTCYVLFYNHLQFLFLKYVPTYLYLYSYLSVCAIYLIPENATKLL